MTKKNIFSKIKLVMLDVDGVLTDGSLYISGNAEEFKVFNVRDGLGIKFLQDGGIRTAICTGRTSSIVRERARELGIDYVRQNQKDKRLGFEEICKEAQVEPEEVAYMGDDIPDLCLFPLVGVACAPADAHPLAKKKAQWISTFNGGHGAVRELAELILQQQGKFEAAVMKRFDTKI